MSETERSIIIHTDKYAGNFERNLAAHVYGRTYDYTPQLGEKLADAFYEEHCINPEHPYNLKEEFRFLEDAFEQRPYDEYGYVPVKMTDENGCYGHTGVEIFLDSYVDHETILKIIEFGKKRLGDVWNEPTRNVGVSNPIKILGFSLKTSVTVTTYESF